MDDERAKRAIHSLWGFTSWSLFEDVTKGFIFHNRRSELISLGIDANLIPITPQSTEEGIVTPSRYGLKGKRPVLVRPRPVVEQFPILPMMDEMEMEAGSSI